MSRAVSRRRLAPAALAVLAAAALTAAPAAASEPSPRCAADAASRPFLPWLDFARYVPAPGGDIEEGGAPWTLDGGSSAVEGNEPFKVGGATDHTSLRLPPGSSATTAPMCVGVDHPTLRFFARRSAGSLTDALLVEAIVSDSAGEEQALPVGIVLSLGVWAPTQPMPIVVNALAIVPGDTLLVAFRFTPRGSGAWSVDDVYVDPYRSR